MAEAQQRLPDSLLARLSEFIAEHIGLHFPGERHGDLERGMRSAAREFGHADVESCVRRLLGSPLTREQVEVLANHLTVGETYFFREKEALAALERQILPPLLQARRRGERRLRLWSAGCCTGEEPYSIAITLARAMPDIDDWNVSILATDINPAFLRKASAGIYGEWSFRNTAAELKSAFFEPAGERKWQLAERVRSMVSFEYLNLARDSFPAVENGTNAMDVVFCRNVLMYFEAARGRQVLEKLALCLMPEGWLFLNPIESSRLAISQLAAVNLGGAFAYRKSATAPTPAPTFDWPPAAAQTSVRLAPPVVKSPPAAVPPRQTPYERASELYARGRYAEATERLAGHASDADAMTLLARAHANQGQLADALGWCEKAVAADKLNPARYYLLSTILLEQGSTEACDAALQRALYLDPNYALAHFALGNLRRHQGKHEHSRRHFRNALAVLRACGSDEVLPESEGLSAGRLAEIVQSTLASELPE